MSAPKADALPLGDTPIVNVVEIIVKYNLYVKVISNKFHNFIINLVDYFNFDIIRKINY